MKILIIMRDKIELCPPILSVAEIVGELGEKVTVITSDISKTNKDRLEQKGIETIIIPYSITTILFKRVLEVLFYRYRLRKILKEKKADLVWIEGAGTFRVMVNLIEKYPFIMQISELYDYEKAKPVRKAIGKLIYKAKAVVMPEINRAELYKKNYELKKNPYVLPNKLHFELDGYQLKRYEDKYQEKLKVFKQKKVILYQGILADERDLSPYITAVSTLGKEYEMVLVGPDRGMLDKYKKINPNLIHIDFTPAPDYLVYTANAFIGIITYKPTTLNCLYCAPNKIYEYGCYGLPMIGNNIPGLSSTIGKYKAGVLVEENVDQIVDAIKMIEGKYDYFSQNSRRLFSETDNVSTIKEILNDVF